MIEAGIAYVPEDRSATGSAPNLSVAENLALKNYRTLGQGGASFSAAAPCATRRRA